MLCVLATQAQARDSGQWGGEDETVRHWYGTLMRPDHPGNSCCGEADAYWADSFEVQGDHYVAIITDERSDEPLKRPHIAAGTRIEVPNDKLKFDQGNPSGHGVIFVKRFSETEPWIVFCYVAPGGI